MDQVIKERWVKALRSGEYEQANGVLMNRHSMKVGSTPKYCCLGVLCKIQGADLSDENRFPRMGTFNLPPGYAAGLSHWDAMRLAEMNDSDRTFSEIADVIEKDY